MEDETDQGSDPSAPTKDEPDYDGGCLLLGKPHHRYGDPYRVCLTANQDKKLFQGKRKRLRKLGCGVFACAYEAPAKTRVIKFTRDGEDVAALLKAQGSGVVPKVFAVYKLAQGGRTIPQEDAFAWGQHGTKEARNVDVYALSVERLRPVSRDEREIVNDELSNIRMAIEDGESQAKYCANRDGEACTATELEVFAAMKKLSARGIKWTDMHAGNIGYDKTGKLKVLDLGVTGTQFESEPDILKGPPERLNLLARI